MSASFMPQVKNIVFLMLENRSLDNVLGWLYAGATPQCVFPANRPVEYDGLAAGRYSNPDSDGTAVPVQPLADDDWKKGYYPPYWDPFEMLRRSSTNHPLPPYPWQPPRTWNGVMNQLFGDQRPITGLPTPASGPPGMKGFLQDYYLPLMQIWKGHDVLWTYTPKQLPVLNGLARSFAVSDRWFCSVPSQTNPNRAYSLCGTSMGRESNQKSSAQEQFNAPTLFNYLSKAGKSWGLYFTDYWMGAKSYTEYTFPWLTRAQGDTEIATLPMFFERAAAGKLPDFTYLEPKWSSLTGAGTDYHPGANFDVHPGEAFVHKVVQAVQNNRKQWPQTLLVITFDEHGGTYDHAPPPWGAINPDGLNGVENGFRFDLFGVRVPTILVSPFVTPGTVFRAPEDSKYPFDHTSFIKTFLLWAGVDLGSVSLGKRMPAAPTFEGVLVQDHVNGANVPNEPLVPAGPAANTGPAHPAGSLESLQALMSGVPVVPQRVILSRSGTPAEVVDEVRRYREDPEKFEAAL